jgi:hypothetical protein
MWQQKEGKFTVFLLHVMCVYWNNIHPIEIFVCKKGYKILLFCVWHVCSLIGCDIKTNAAAFR